MSSADEQAAALKRAALEMAIEYNARAAEHRTSHGPRSPRQIMADADQFFAWLRDTAERAGISADDVNAETR